MPYRSVHGREMSALFAAAIIIFLVAPIILSARDEPSNSEVSAEETRVRRLEQQVHSLAEEVALLRREIQVLRNAKSGGLASDGRVSFVSAETEPRMLRETPTLPLKSSPRFVPAQGSQTQALGGAAANAKLLNPDISLIGDFIGAMGRNPVVASPSIELHESELGLQAIIDPFARADAFLSFGEEGVEVEEGYLTFTALPAGLLLKAGKMRAEFGKVNTIHNHTLSFIDRPLVTNNLVGGEEGISDAGLSLSRLLPAPAEWFLEGTAQVFRGDSGDVFQANRRQDLSVVGHLRGYRDISESTNIDLGVSYARGHNAGGVNTEFDPSRFLTNLYSADATFRWKPLRRAIYNSFLFRSEFFWSARDQLSSSGLPETQHTFGFYSAAEYRLNRRWTLGGRFDRSGHAANASLTDIGFSTILTYWPSEFSQVRGQYRFGRLADPVTASYSNANEFLFQFLFIMGAHGAHPF